MLTTGELTSIGRAVALEHRRAFDVKAVAVTDGGSGRAEMVVTVGGRHKAPSRFVINVTRIASAEFEAEFRTKLSEAITRHSTKQV